MNEPTANVDSQSGEAGPTTRNTHINTGVSTSHTARNDSTMPRAATQPPCRISRVVVGSAMRIDSSRAGAGASSGSSSNRPRQPTSDSSGLGAVATETNARRSPSP